MSAARRWCLVALGVLALVLTPLAVEAWPASQSEVSAPRLLQQIRDSQDLAYSGYVESTGGIAFPTTEQFGGVADLLGDRNRLRVWWRGPDTWRVDKVATGGETGLYSDGELSYAWDYESLEATPTLHQLSPLPRTVDLVPPQLAHRVLADARTEEVSRLPVERIAGRDAAGLRLTPSEPQSSIDHVDVWADTETGLPVRVEVWGEGEQSTAVATGFIELSLEPPDEETTTFAAAPGVDVMTGGIGGESLVSHIPEAFVAPRLAGLANSYDGSTLRAGPSLVTRYGHGVTQLLVIGLDDEIADPLREQLAATAGRVIDDRLGTSLAAGAMHLLLTPCQGDEPSWLLVGTVDEATLLKAAEVAVRQRSSVPLASYPADQ